MYVDAMSLGEVTKGRRSAFGGDDDSCRVILLDHKMNHVVQGYVTCTYLDRFDQDTKGHGRLTNTFVEGYDWHEIPTWKTMAFESQVKGHQFSLGRAEGH